MKNTYYIFILLGIMTISTASIEAYHKKSVSNSTPSRARDGEHSAHGYGQDGGHGGNGGASDSGNGGNGGNGGDAD